MKRGWISDGNYIDEFPISFGCDDPDDYADLPDSEKQIAELAHSQCVISPGQYFLRGVLEIKIREHNEPFTWGLWVRVLEADFDEVHDHWEMKGRENTDGPYKCRIANEIGIYSQPTRNLIARLKVRPVGQRPLIIVEDSDHPLALQQKFGIDFALASELSRSIKSRK